MKGARYGWIGIGLLGIIAGCHNQPQTAAAPPATTQEACAQVREILKESDVPTEGPPDMSIGCRLRFAASSSVDKVLNRRLAENGWKSEASAWLAPTTRCTIEETELAGGPPVHGGVGVAGGTHLSPSFGFGIDIGSFGAKPLNYKIDCLPLENKSPGR